MASETEEVKALTEVVTPEVVDLDVIRRDIGPAIDKALNEAHRIAAAVKDDTSRELAINAVERVQGHLDSLNRWRKDFYEPKYRDAEEARENFDPRIKSGKAIVKTIMASVSEYNVRKEREARIARERAEAEARRQVEEAERAKQAAIDAERRAKEAIEAEKRRKAEAEEAERRRVAAEAEAKIRAEREAREAAAAETTRKIKEEEDARLRHAQEAKDVGNVGKVDAILEQPTPISPVLASPHVAPDLKTLALEQELAAKAAAEKAERERQEQEIADADLRKAKADAEAAKEAAAQAEAAAKMAQAAASMAVVTRPDPRTTSVTRWKWDLDSDGTLAGDRAAFMALAKAVVEGRAPVEYLGFDLDHPDKFRPTAVNADVQRLKERFVCPGLKAYAQQDEQLKRRTA